MLFSTLRNSGLGKARKALSELFTEAKEQGHRISRSKNTMNASTSAIDLTTVRPTFVAVKTKPLLRRDKHQRTAAKKWAPYVPGTVSLQVLGTGANGSPSSVYLFTDQSRYLFNCGEGTQRLAHEHKTKLARLEQIFVTRNTWAVTGGFPGLALTVQDAGVRELALHGPPHLDSILHSMKRFVVLKNLRVTTKDCTEVHFFEDATMTVRCVPLYSSVSQQAVIAYICKLKPRPGALNLEKCVEHGVPPGPLLGQLKNGADVTLANGVVVRSKDVSEPNESPLSFVFLDLPSVDFLNALEEKAALFEDLRTVTEVAAVVHFSPACMLRNNCYQALIKAMFDDSTHHLQLNSPENCFSGYVAAHRIQYQLNQLHPRLFPLLAESNETNFNLGSKSKKTKSIGSNEKENLAEEHPVIDEATSERNGESGLNSLTSFHLRPKKGLDHSTEAKLNPKEYISETQALPEFPTLLDKLKAGLKTFAATSDNEDEYPKIVFLGTGSCIPNKTRNVSSILVQPAADSYMLLDCGEGSLGQIVRFFGRTKAEHVMRNLHIIYVSHLHADHHIGLIGLLNERRRLHCEYFAGEEPQKVLLLAPMQIESWLSFYDEQIECISDAYELVPNGELLAQPMLLSDAKHQHIGVTSIGTCLVRHCPHSFGVSFTLSGKSAQVTDATAPIKITYSGDTMPCPDLVELGRNSTILIHEATMEDDLIEEAKVKMHSTISQAIQQGRAMQAQHIILTHFSQRYAKMPRMQNIGAEAEAQLMHNVAIAFDNMQVSLADLAQFHLLYPALRALFAEHAEELEQKALKRELKLERKRKLINVS